MITVDEEIMQIENAISWNIDRLENCDCEISRRRYEQNIRDLTEDKYDLIRWEAVNS